MFWRILWKIAFYFFFVSIAWVVLFRFVPIPVTFLMLQRCVEQKMDGKEMKLTKEWISIDKISPNLILAVVSSEDNNFTEHWGFDFNAIKKAAEYNNRKHVRHIKGASTISQQTAKNVFLFPSRSWIRKGFEVYFTVLIETLWSKKRIMEVYLNVTEMGDGTYGAEAAAQKYFKKHAKGLSKNESALLAAILPNPRKWSPVKPNSYIYKRQVWISWNMNNIGKVEW